VRKKSVAASAQTLSSNSASALTLVVLAVELASQVTTAFSSLRVRLSSSTSSSAFSITANAVEKWEEQLNTPETWTVLEKTPETWQDTTNAVETWSATPPTSKEWTVASATSETWADAA
jgi:hypothetical protein